jgi:hypothetical protein
MRKGILTAAAVLILAAAPMAQAKGEHADSGQTTVFCSDGSITYSPSTLWPPDHKLVPIAISFNQPCDDGAGNTPSSVCGTGTISLTVNSIKSSEDPEGKGCGKPDPKQGPDFTGVGLTSSVQNEPATVTVTPSVRAERCGTGTGRVYDINVTCFDEELDEAANVDLFVTVPHDQGK